MTISIGEITAVTVNWLTARRTLGTVDSLRQFYPDLPVIVVDDASSEDDRHKFFRVYRAKNRNAEVEYDPNTSKLKERDDIRYIQGPDLSIHPRSHGHCVDLAIGAMTTPWMLHIHSDYRLLKPGMLEEMIDGLDDSFCAAGARRGRGKYKGKCSTPNSIAALYNVEAGKGCNASFRPAIYLGEGKAILRPIEKGMSVPSHGVPIEAGAYFTAKLCHLGYEVKWVSSVHRRYGVHLRWLEEQNGWNGPY